MNAESLEPTLGTPTEAAGGQERVAGPDPQAAVALGEPALSALHLIENMVSGFAHCQMRFEGEWPADFRYLAVNPAFEALTGLHGVVGRWVSEAIPGIRERDPGLLGVPQQTCNQGQSSPTLLF